MLKVGVYQGGTNVFEDNMNVIEALLKRHSASYNQIDNQKNNDNENEKEKNIDESLDLICFAELFLNGYGAGLASIQNSAENLHSGTNIQRLQNLCSKYRVGIVVGYAETENELLYNSAVFIDKNGEILMNYRKTHLWGCMENEYFQSGSSLLPPVTFQGVKISLLICFDVEFPETVRSLALLGTQLVIVPTALASDNGFNAKITIPSRAFENGIFVAYVNRVGEEDSQTFNKPIRYCGLSTLIAPNGSELVRFDENEVGLKIAMIDPSQLEYTQCRSVNPYLSSLRPSLYTTTNQ